MEWIETDRAALPAGCAAPMQQHGRYGEACAALGARPRHFQLRRGGDLAGTALVLIRRWPLFGDFALLSRGPVWAAGVSAETRAAGTRALIRQLRAHVRGVMCTPEPDGASDPLEDSDLLPMVTPGHVARLDLTQPRDARRACLHGKWRNRLVRAEASGLTVRHAPLPEDPDHWLLLREAAQARTRGYRRLPRAFTHAWTTHGGRDATRLFTAHSCGTPVAAMLFLRHGASASYHIGWCGPEGRRLNAHNLLLWHASDWLASRDYLRLELGTLDTVGTPGLARFKLGAGAEDLRLGATRLDAPGTRPLARLLRQRPAIAYASSSASQ